ncbi:MAG: hypothetical protein CVU90_07010 [Firmicutes bacterium HGW-Firmicutes-15]|nr:MAG: hypothetical protein CVU90_07010 [Firmicutes bacterium HGW-Firmicutes-15]
MIQLRIEQQYAMIGMDIRKPSINLHSTLPSIELQTSPAELEMESPRPRIHIDQRQCFADAGLKSPSVLSEDCVARARSQALEGIGRRVSEGNQLAKINGATVADVAGNSYIFEDKVDFNCTAIPKQRPEISFDLQPVAVNFRRGEVQLQLRRGTVENNFEWGKVDIYLRQKNYVKMYCAEPNINASA